MDIDDMAELIDGTGQIAPAAGDLDVGLIDKPAVTDRVPAGLGRIDEQLGEALYPPVYRKYQRTATAITSGHRDHIGRQSEYGEL